MEVYSPKNYLLNEASKYVNTANDNVKAGEYMKAFKLYIDSLEIRNDILGFKHNLTIECFNSISNLI